MRVPFVDLYAQHRPLEAELTARFQRIVNRACFTSGPDVADFEEQFASYLNISECVAVNSGTAALHLVLQALGIGPGDEVITVPNSFIATAEAISAVGAQPVFVDVDPVSYTMSAIAAENALTPRTRAILPVHLYGQPADLDPLLALARRHDIALIEDACQAHGARYKETKVGTLGTAGCFSFYPTKNLGCCGEGGAVVTDDHDLARYIRMLRDHGSLRKYEHLFPGYNCRMEGIQGAILGLKLPHLEQWNERRRLLAQRYNRQLAGTGLVTPAEMSYARHVYHLYVVLSEHRNALREHLAAHGIETGLHYPTPLHRQQAYSHLRYKLGDFPVTDHLSEHILSLPLYPEMAVETVDYVASAVHSLKRRRVKPLKVVTPKMRGGSTVEVETAVAEKLSGRSSRETCVEPTLCRGGHSPQAGGRVVREQPSNANRIDL